MVNNVKTIIGKVFSIPESSIKDESSPENIESWDSFHGLILVDELENSFNVKFTLSEITNIKNVADIKQSLKNHNVSFDE